MLDVYDGYAWITANGEVYSFGWNGYAQLGHGDTGLFHTPVPIPTSQHQHHTTTPQHQHNHTVADDRDIPTLISALTDSEESEAVRVKAVACGGWHSVFLSGSDSERMNE